MFQSVKSFVYVALCDPACAVSAANILSCYLFNSSMKDEIINDERLIGTMRLLYTSSDSNNEGLSQCQLLFESFLKETYHCGKPYDVSVNNVIVQFSKINQPLFSVSASLQKLAKELASQLRLQ